MNNSQYLYNFEIQDNNYLLALCGTNNENLHILEELLGNPVFLSGNKISFMTHNLGQLENFKHICKILLDAAAQSLDITPDFISSTFFQYTGNKISMTRATSSQTQSRHTLDEAVHIKIPITEKIIVPRSEGQKKVIQSLYTNVLSFLVGPAGTGKTYLVTAYALSQLLNKKKDKFIITRPVVEAGEKLGYLPGDLEQKIFPYLRPIYDALYELGDESVINLLQERRQIEIAPLAYMRGRTLNRAIVLLDEAQNCTPLQMKMLLTRLGNDVQCIVNGDLEQSDISKENGLSQAIEIFKHHTDLIATVHLNSEDVQRSKLAKIVIEAYNSRQGHNSVD